MPVQSTYASFELPNVDLWKYLFDRTDRKFPDDKSASAPILLGCP